MKKTMYKLILTILFVFATLFSMVSIVEAKSAYKTYTLDRENHLIETNEAYEAVHMVRTLSDGSTLDSAKDMFIDEEDYLYIADTGNKRIVVMNPELEVLYSFGEDVLVKPLGIFVVDDDIYVADYGVGLTQSDVGAIYVWHVDKTKDTTEEAISLVNVYSTPSSEILEIDQFLFRPTKISVDKNRTMYVVNEGTTSGVLIINSSNRFIDYFASNSIQISLWDRLERIVYSANDNVNLTKNIPTPVYNITLDNLGYYYTITQSSSDSEVGDNLKKVNIAGINFFDDNMMVYSDIVDAWCGSVGNIYAVSTNGFLFEYDSLGNLLFMWGGKGLGNDKLGLFMSASTIAVDSKNNVYVIDDNSSRNSIQIFRETPFAAQVHEALDLYYQARYIESIDVWKEVLRYNSMFDLAYEGIGLGYQMNEQYDLALENFKIAYDQQDYSDAFWEIRSAWMTENAQVFLWVFLGIVSVGIIVRYTNKKYHYLAVFSKSIGQVKQYKLPRELIYMFRFIKHPADACYEIKSKNKVSYLSAWFILFLLFVLYVVGLLLTGFIFNNVIIEQTILFKEAMKIFLPILIFIVANYLMSSLMEGEGTFKATFINTVGALMPVFIIYPIVILLSNVLTVNESFLYQAGLFIMIVWALILVYFNVKETHNYSVGQTFANLFMTLLTMIIIIVVLLMVYLMLVQVTNFVSDIVKEVILRD